MAKDLAQTARAPSPWVTRFTAELPATGRIIDIACGSGRHTRLLVPLGYQLTAVDRNLSGIQDLSNLDNVELLKYDLESDIWPFQPESAAGIIVANYLHRPHFKLLCETLANNGLLIFETFAVGNEAFGRPRNPEFLLKPGELRDVFGGCMDILGYEEVEEKLPKPAIKQRICARKSQFDTKV